MKHTFTRTARAGSWVLIAVALVVVALAVAGCAAKASALTVDKDDNSVTLSEGQELVVKLEGNPSTGFGWVVVDDADGMLEQAGEPTIEEPKTQGSQQIVGQAQMQTFTFRTVKTGSATLTMEYKRSWETTVPAERTFSVDVTVK